MCVYEVRVGGNKWPFELTGDLEWIDVPERWDMRDETDRSTLDLDRYWDAIKGCPPNWIRIPAHREYLPGVRVDTQYFPSLHTASVRARERALCLSGHMLPGPFLHEERFTWEEGKGLVGKVEIHEKPAKSLTPELSQTLRQLGLRYE